MTAVPWPELVRVNGQTGDYYVISRQDSPTNTRSPRKLLKVSGRGEAARIVAELPLRPPLGNTLALGQRDGRPVLWIAGGSSLLCLSDGGTEFETVQTAFVPPNDAQLDWNRLAVDYDRDVLYVNNGASLMWRYDGKSGQGGLLRLGGRREGRRQRGDFLPFRLDLLGERP